ncbi:hypothetical protein Prudu_019244 [Prunus dulcis]|uniref:HTH three-helical bundle domain-containing protein n=1 Tax=Prunus dulcis TaxID=3755 RepID=A0A4Y1RTS4_PRUDU|nr:hypothetical protein Prudu_019244 [Prunus dulcis]
MRGCAEKSLQDSNKLEDRLWIVGDGVVSICDYHGVFLRVHQLLCGFKRAKAKAEADTRHGQPGIIVVPGGARKRKRLSFSAHMRRKAEEILKLLSGGCCFSEVKIRQTIGDTPDTSKALRITKPFALRGKNVLTWRDVNGLLKLEKVKRSGIGGRYNPYIYTIA